jgi:hypothetical protein
MSRINEEYGAPTGLSLLELGLQDVIVELLLGLYVRLCGDGRYPPRGHAQAFEEVANLSGFATKACQLGDFFPGLGYRDRRMLQKKPFSVFLCGASSLSGPRQERVFSFSIPPS